jgi:hypothetical protein
MRADVLARELRQVKPVDTDGTGANLKEAKKSQDEGRLATGSSCQRGCFL